MKGKRKGYPRVEVEWLDSAGMAEWGGEDEYQKQRPLIIKSVGYLLNKGSGHVTLVQNVDENRKMNGSMSIPRSVVRKITVLTSGRDSDKTA